MKVVGTIGKHGRAVVVGRGANFILPPEKRFSVRIVAAQAWRINNVAQEFDISSEDAKRRVMRTESDRRAFIRKYFNADIADPTNYDLVVNTATLDVDDAVKVISSALGLVECVFVGSLFRKLTVTVNTPKMAASALLQTRPGSCQASDFNSPFRNCLKPLSVPRQAAFSPAITATTTSFSMLISITSSSSPILNTASAQRSAGKPLLSQS